MDFKRKFYDITNLVQQEFERNLELYGNKIQCRKGCSKCCSQIFRINPLDGWIITEHVKSLTEKERERLISNAKEYLCKVSLIKGDLGGFKTDHPVPTNVGTPLLSKEGSYENAKGGIPCPALGSEGECTIYEARPIICRRFGMPIYDYKNPTQVHACDLNFEDGEEITDPLLIPNQTEIGKKWDEVKEEFNESQKKGLPAVALAKAVGSDSTTIADAIVKAGND